jgi:glucosamine--fructose-6-phosphate aminotransferase (isomerizing)
LGIVTEGDSEAIATVDDHITVPACPLHTAVVPSTVALQLLSYHIARLKDCSIDQPRNLAKSVTVE